LRPGMTLILWTPRSSNVTGPSRHLSPESRAKKLISRPFGRSSRHKTALCHLGPHSVHRRPFWRRRKCA
jgi:hypothetical protein